jgi:HEPN domain-containing protein
MDTSKQVDYWRRSAEEDFAAASDLLEKKRFRHALFFAELAVEKLLKAHVARATQKTPPRGHDLLRLAETGQVSLSDDQRAFLARIQEYCFEGRYPVNLSSPVVRFQRPRRTEHLRNVGRRSYG